MDVGLVCDSCSTFNPIGVHECARCGASLSLDGARSPVSVIPAGSAPAPRPADDDVPNATPTAPTREQHFDPPARTPKKTQVFGVMQESRAKLVLIKGDGLDGVSFTLAGSEHLVGRSEDASILFEEDRFLSPIHANFFFRFGTLFARDEASVNGVYIRIQGTVQLQYGDRFLVGEQMLEVQATPESGVPEPTEDGTYFFGSPRRPAYFRVIQILQGGDGGLSYRAERPLVTIGREGNDIDFPDDPFISGRHARISWKNKQLTLTDLDSKNGTFLRISGERPLGHGDYVFMGQQLLRVEIV
ncbi:FHA domain-containing protein [Haliangium sp.]|uniref:FHA domain-containing protein n=1 Tax=Haliangium sp. TaxID=2663208 RepID=UPI003D0F268E